MAVPWHCCTVLMEQWTLSRAGWERDVEHDRRFDWVVVVVAGRRVDVDRHAVAAGTIALLLASGPRSHLPGLLLTAPSATSGYNTRRFAIGDVIAAVLAPKFWRQNQKNSFFFAGFFFFSRAFLEAEKENIGDNADAECGRRTRTPNADTERGQQQRGTTTSFKRQLACKGGDEQPQSCPPKHTQVA